MAENQPGKDDTSTTPAAPAAGAGQGAHEASAATDEAGSPPAGAARPEHGGRGGGPARGRGGRGPREGRRRDNDEGDVAFQEIVVKVNRCAKVMKGGRRFSFSALVVVGNRDGRVGFGFGKARAVPNAVEKGVKDAKKNLVSVPRVGTTIPHQIASRFESSTVRLIPAAPGTGIVAGGTVRAVMELAGVKDILTKAFGQTNPVNLVKATFKGLESLRTREQTESLRGVTL